jgi:kinesin family protein 4/21/27
MVDLAGSERQSLSEQNEKLTKECIEINKSLFTLRKVITTLTEAQTTGRTIYVPYRDSKLTCLLRESIGGNSYSLMISCLSPSDKFVEENISTLNYSTKAAYISNKPIKNQDPKIRLISDLKVSLRNLLMTN